MDSGKGAMPLRQLGQLVGRLYSCADSIRCQLRVLMLPNSNRRPPGGSQPFVGIAITLQIALDLFGPVPAIGAMCATSMIGTAMPEATINEDGESGPWEHHVSLSSEIWQRSTMHEITQTEPVKFSA
jgi:hypothetical protein